VLEELGVPQVPVAGIAKAREGDGTVRRGKARVAPNEAEDDRVFVPGRSNPVSFRRERGGFFLLQRVRDEAHRFAISYHRKRRAKRTLRSVLDDIPGVGPARRRALLKHFGSVRAVASASEEDLAAVPGMSRALARRIREFFAS
jgi:excinuclease ABC subunit C